MSDSAPAFDEFLIRSEHQIAHGPPINSRTTQATPGNPFGWAPRRKTNPRLKNSVRKEHTYVNPASVGDARPPVSR